MQAIHAPVHTRESVEQTIKTALEIATPYEGDTIKWCQVFNNACELLGARASAFVQPQPFGVDLAGIRTGKAA